METMKVKLRNKNNIMRRAQSTVEYAVVIACLVGALWTMQIYIKRSLQGRFKESADEIGDQYSAMATHSNYSQKMTQSVNVTGTTMWKQDLKTGKNYEVTEVVRNEYSKVDIPEGSFEETGDLSAEQLYDEYDSGGSGSGSGGGGRIPRW